MRNIFTNTAAIEFEPGEELGRGAYGRVFKAKYRGSVCAAKEIHSILIQFTQMAPEERRRLQESFQRECDHCSKLNHPNIIRFIGIYHPPQQLFPTHCSSLLTLKMSGLCARHIMDM